MKLSTDMPKTILKYSCTSFYSKRPKYRGLYLFRFENQSAKFANVLKKKNKRGTCFSLTGRIPELYVTALGTLKYTAIFCPLFSVFGPEPIYQRVSKGDVTILITTKFI
jgi:acetyl-CoA synthetase